VLGQLAIKDQRTRHPLDSIPEPSKATRPCLSLIDLTPNTCIDTIVKVTRIKAKEKEDDLGKRPHVFGIAEDSTLRTPFMCYKPYRSFLQDSIVDSRMHMSTDLRTTVSASF
jgi:hypothetical protein